MPSWGIFEATRNAAEGFRVRLRAPHGTSCVQTFSGRQLYIGSDGTAEMSADDAQYLLRAGWTKIAQ
jgi:hypothetical protein